jgi:hypothetical protein
VGLSEGGEEMMEGGSGVPEGDIEGGISELGGAGGEARGEGKNGGRVVVGEVAGGSEIGVGTVGGDVFGDGVGEVEGAWDETGEKMRDMERRRRIGKGDGIAIGGEEKRCEWMKGCKCE